MLRERGHVVQQYGATPFTELAECDAVVIASPPECHEAQLRWYWDKAHILCEGPVTFWQKSHHHYGINMTAENWVFVPEVQQLLQKCGMKRAAHAHLHFEYDLAKWRPDTDMRSTCYYYSGIDNINVHEVMVALSLFGHATRTSVFKQHTGKSLAVDALTMNIQHERGTLTTINSGWHSSVYNRNIIVWWEDGSSDVLGWTTPTDDAVCNQSYSDMIDHWLKGIYKDNALYWPSLYTGYRAWKLIQGEI